MNCHRDTLHEIYCIIFHNTPYYSILFQFYVYNDIFRYQDEVFNDLEDNTSGGNDNNTTTFEGGKKVSNLTDFFKKCRMVAAGWSGTFFLKHIKVILLFPQLIRLCLGLFHFAQNLSKAKIFSTWYDIENFCPKMLRPLRRKKNFTNDKLFSFNLIFHFIPYYSSTKMLRLLRTKRTLPMINCFHFI